jgi:hypothetical protein
VELMNAMPLTPPAGSRVNIKNDNDGDPVIVIPSDGGLIRYGLAMITVCWLGGWFLGFRFTLTKLLSGTDPTPGYHVLWLAVWTFFGALAALYLYRELRSPVPETLTLKFDRVIYDSGIPFRLDILLKRRTVNWNYLLAKRTIVELDKRQLASLRLHATPAGSRLIVDADRLHLDLASTGSEIDREWLFRVLAQRYVD